MSANDFRWEPVAAINGCRTRHHRARRADVRRRFVNLTVSSQVLCLQRGLVLVAFANQL